MMRATMPSLASRAMMPVVAMVGCRQVCVRTTLLVAARVPVLAVMRPAVAAVGDVALMLSAVALLTGVAPMTPLLVARVLLTPIRLLAILFRAGLLLASFFLARVPFALLVAFLLWFAVAFAVAFCVGLFVTASLLVTVSLLRIGLGVARRIVGERRFRGDERHHEQHAKCSHQARLNPAHSRVSFVLMKRHSQQEGHSPSKRTSTTASRLGTGAYCAGNCSGP